MKLHLDIGYVSKAHGLHGEVAVKTFDPSSEALLEVERVLLRSKAGEEREYSIESVRVAGAVILVCLEGVEGRVAGVALQGSTVAVFRDDLEPPKAGEFFQGDLVGLEARTPEGQVLGKVEEVWSSGPVPNLVIRGAAGELLVPFAQEFVRGVDTKSGVVTVIAPELA